MKVVASHDRHNSIFRGGSVIADVMQVSLDASQISDVKSYWNMSSLILGSASFLDL
jgi:hypothetical protein